MRQCVAVCCSVLQCVAVFWPMYCSASQCVTGVLQCMPGVLRCVAECCSVLPCVEVSCGVLQRVVGVLQCNECVF
jgi:hypothetical protein